MGRWIILISLLFIITAVLSLTVFREKIKAVFYIGHMETDDRINRMHIDKVVSKLNIKQGDYIADIGAGSGLFSRKLSKAVTPSGKIYSVDINKELLKHIDAVNVENGIKNIKTILAGENDPRIPELVHLIFLCDVLHLIDRQEQYIKTAAGYLTDKGRIAVISFKASWPPTSKKFTEKELTGWMQKSGLTLISYDDFIPDQYLAIYKKEK